MIDGATIRRTRGVPGGLVLVPTLCNILYNSVLGLELPSGCISVVYADNMVLMVKSRDQYSLMGNDKIFRAFFLSASFL